MRSENRNSKENGRGGCLYITLQGLLELGEVSFPTPVSRQLMQPLPEIYFSCQLLPDQCWKLTFFQLVWSGRVFLNPSSSFIKGLLFCGTKICRYYSFCMFCSLGIAKGIKSSTNDQQIKIPLWDERTSNDVMMIENCL